MFVCHNMQLRRKSFSLFLCQNFLPSAQDVQILFNFKFNYFFFFYQFLILLVFVLRNWFCCYCHTQKNQISLTKTQHLQENVISGLAFALVQYVYYE